MNKGNIVLEKSFAFALRIIKFHDYLQKNRSSSILSKQVLRSGTSIGANCEEANSAQSKKDFIAKFSISLKEAKETKYWIRLLYESGFVEEKLAKSLLEDCEELIKLLISIIKTSRKSLN